MKVNQKNKVINVNNKPIFKTKKENNINNPELNRENTEENKYIDKNIDNGEENNKGIIYKKITKPPELENFDTSSHLIKNITSFDSNCKDQISEKSYYCISCKQSVCTACGAYEHKDHILIQRDNCLFYDPNFFVEISKIIDISLNLYSKKNSIKDTIDKSISYIKNYLDELKIIKFKEIDEFFEKTNNNLKNLKQNFLEAKNFIKNYYIKNKKFFNINYNKEINNSNVEESIDNYNNFDIENSIFIINFDLMNLFDSKNLIVLDKINELTNKINSISDILDKKTNELTEIINKNYDLEFNNEYYEDFYYDIKIRIQKYSNFIYHFQETISDIIQKTGNIEKIKELLDIFDSNNKKSKDIIFQQNFFLKENNNVENNITPRLSTINEKDKDKDKEKKLNNCKSNNSILNSNNKYKNKNNINYSNSKSAKKVNNTVQKEKETLSPNKNRLNKYYNSFNNNNLPENQNNNNANNLILSSRTLAPNKYNKVDVILDNRIIQRFFAYSINDFYKENIIKDNNSNSMEENKNIKIKKKKNKVNENNKIINLKSKENNSTLKKIKTNQNIINKKKLFPDYNFNKNTTEELELNQYNIKSVAYLKHYQNRYNSLKERTKPIIGSNQIQLFEPTAKKIIKKTTLLKKEENGYSFFPDGCRHILIDNILYITGGNNNCGHIVLSYNIVTNELSRLSNFIFEHYFHTLEYVDNFDCIICIGGENSANCEIMDINDKKWKKLPSLNYPRANSNIYYNNITEQIYALFGMKGNLWDKNSKNSDKIEVLNLNNIDNGWINIEYYKSIGLDLKVNFCKTMPFTKDKLIIFGGNNVRSLEEQSFYALFDMNKNEIIKVDKPTMELIKLEEKRMRIADLALTKIN